MEPTFWSGTFTEWAGLLIVAIPFLLAMAAMLVKMGRDRQKSEDEVKQLRLDMLEKFAEHGRRLGGQESSCSAHNASINDLKSQYMGLNLEMANNTREVTRCATNNDGMEKKFNTHISNANEVEKVIRERLAVIETKVNKGG